MLKRLGALFGCLIVLAAFKSPPSFSASEFKHKITATTDLAPPGKISWPTINISQPTIRYTGFIHGQNAMKTLLVGDNVTYELSLSQAFYAVLPGTYRVESHPVSKLASQSDSTIEYN